MLEQQARTDVQAAVAEHAGQADHLQFAVGRGHRVAAGEGLEIRRGRNLLHRHLPQLAVARAVQLARPAEGLQLPGGTLDAGALLADQPQRPAGQARGEGGEQVVGQFARLGQEQYCAGERLRRHLGAELAAPGIARLERQLLVLQPAPALRLGQLAEQAVGRQAGEQHGTAEQFGLTQQHFATRIHRTSPEQKAGRLGKARGAGKSAGQSRERGRSQQAGSCGSRFRHPTRRRASARLCQRRRRSPPAGRRCAGAPRGYPRRCAG
ncbi:hypothetical protein D3C84_286260 [compost metagenome]